MGSGPTVIRSEMFWLRFQVIAGFFAGETDGNLAFFILIFCAEFPQPPAKKQILV